MFETTKEPYPHGYDERQAVRNMIKMQMVEHALAEAKTVRRSIKCRNGDHHRVDSTFGPAGCANDGTTCLCECHDETGNGS